MDPDSDIIHSDHDESEEGDTVETSTSGDAVFSAPQQVFIVRAISKAMTGFRPSVMCEGYLAELSNSTSGYLLTPLGRDQQLSFKYEPPSPKFSRKRPSCISYRLQLLQGSQFLYSLRGLPKVLRCQRSANALEWGQVHLVFAAAADLDTFIATLKYVEVEEMAPVAKGQQHASRQASGAGAAAADSEGGDGSGGGLGRPSTAGSGLQWAAAAARLLAAQSAGEVVEASAGAPVAAGAAAAAGTLAEAAAPPAGGRSSLLDWARRCLSLPPESPLPLLTATAGAAVLAAAAAAAAAAFLLRGGSGSSARRKSV